MYKIALALVCLSALAACGSDNSETCLGGTKCGDSCVDVAHDQLNCGGCGVACGARELCTDGACVDAGCPSGSAECGSSCVALASDSQNCGTCGHACAAGQVCSGGACAATCALPTSACGSSCIDLTRDPSHCGGCGVACDAGKTCLASACVLEDWQPLTDLADYTPSMSSNVPAGETSFYVASFSNFWRVDAPDTVVDLAPPPADIDDYSSIARLGQTLYVSTTDKLYAYAIADNTWTTPIDDLAVNTSYHQTAVDDGGFLYVGGQNASAVYQLAKIKVSDMTVEYFDMPPGLGTEEPRTVWDQASRRIYVADFADSDNLFYAFDPATNTFSSDALALVPGYLGTPHGFSDATCSDNHGHIFTSTSQESDTSIFMYTTGADTWSRLPSLPMPVSDSAACAVAGGWLYVISNHNGVFKWARYPIGN